MVRNYLSFKRNSPEVEELLKWWKGLEKDDRGGRAELRRCHTLSEIAFSPAYHRLRLSLENLGKVNYDGLALVVGLAARVTSDEDNGSFAEQMAAGKGDGSARVSGLRFRRLLKVREQEELFAALTRIIAVLGGAVNLRKLAQGVYFWNEITRKEWAFDYYSKAPGEK